MKAIVVNSRSSRFNETLVSTGNNSAFADVCFKEDGGEAPIGAGSTKDAPVSFNADKRWVAAGTVRNPIVYQLVRQNGEAKGIKVISAKKVTKDELLMEGKTVILTVDEAKLAVHNAKSASNTGVIFLNATEVANLIKSFGLTHDIKDSTELIACINQPTRTPQGYIYTEVIVEIAESYGVVKDEKDKPINLLGDAQMTTPKGELIEIKQATTFQGEDGNFYYHNEHGVNRRVSNILFSKEDMSEFVARYRKAAKANDLAAEGNESGN